MTPLLSYLGEELMVLALIAGMFFFGPWCAVRETCRRCVLATNLRRIAGFFASACTFLVAAIFAHDQLHTDCWQDHAIIIGLTVVNGACFTVCVVALTVIMLGAVTKLKALPSESPEAQ